jgi:hypothetical protein
MTTNRGNEVICNPNQAVGLMGMGSGAGRQREQWRFRDVAAAAPAEYIRNPDVRGREPKSRPAIADQPSGQAMTRPQRVSCREIMNSDTLNGRLTIRTSPNHP